MSAYDAAVKVAKGVGIAVLTVPAVAIGLPCVLVYEIYSGISGFFRGPKSENETIRKTREQQEMERKTREQERLVEKYTREIEEGKCQANDPAETLRLEELAREERKRRNREKREQKEEARLSGEATVREDQEAKSQDGKKEVIEPAKNGKEGIGKERLLEESIAKLVKLQRIAKEMVENGIPPEYLPTEEEMQQASRGVQYSPQNFHFAVAGKSGSGKSSLINAFLNLGSREYGAARSGTKETTREIGRYPDPGNLPPRQWTVWYDIPGAGTQIFPSSQYFNTLGLFVFDVIILVMADRFEEIDLEILKNCERFKIPSLIVRSKAEMHINNLMEEYDDDIDRPDDQVLYKQCRDQFINETQETVSEELTKAGLPLQPVYIVSRKPLREIYRDSLEGFSEGPKKALVEPKGTIHEVQLIKSLMLKAQERRCTGEEGGVEEKLQETLDKVTEKTISVVSAFKRDFHGRDQSSPASVSTTLSAITRGIRGGMKEALQTQQTAGNSSTAAPKVPRSKNRHQQPTYQEDRWVKRILYLQAPSYVNDLRRELARHNPELPALYAIPPRMLSPKVVLLQFYPGKEIPETIHAFGKTPRLAPYEQKTSRTRTPTTSAARNAKSNNRNSGNANSRHQETPEAQE